jgi:hypothetical protein
MPLVRGKVWGDEQDMHDGTIPLCTGDCLHEAPAGVGAGVVRAARAGVLTVATGLIMTAGGRTNL